MSSSLTLIRWIWKRIARTTLSKSTTPWWPLRVVSWKSEFVSCLFANWFPQETTLRLILQSAGNLKETYGYGFFPPCRMCGYYSPSEPLTFLSSGNVMLVTMATNDKNNYPGFRAQVSQILRGSKSKNYFLSETWLKLTWASLLFAIKYLIFGQMLTQFFF